MGTGQIQDEIKRQNPVGFAVTVGVKQKRRREATDEQWKGSLGHLELGTSTAQTCLEQEVGISILDVLCFLAY